MASTALGLHTPDEVKRRVMFALELVDPVTGRLAFADMVVTAPGFAPPVRSASGRFVWIDVDPPAQRTVKVTATSKRRISSGASRSSRRASTRRRPACSLRPAC